MYASIALLFLILAVILLKSPKSRSMGEIDNIEEIKAYTKDISKDNSDLVTIKKIRKKYRLTLLEAKQIYDTVKS